jgi:hypothetical protein
MPFLRHQLHAWLYNHAISTLNKSVFLSLTLLAVCLSMEVVVIMALPLPLHQQYMVNCSSRVRKVLKELTKILLESFTSLWNLAIVSSYASRMWYLSAHAISCLLDAIFYKVKHKLFCFDARLTCLIHSGFM